MFDEEFTHLQFQCPNFQNLQILFTEYCVLWEKLNYFLFNLDSWFQIFDFIQIYMLYVAYVYNTM